MSISAVMLQNSKASLFGWLYKKYSNFFKQFEKVHKNNINFELLPQTKDVWAVNYMQYEQMLKGFLLIAV